MGSFEERASEDEMKIEPIYGILGYLYLARTIFVAKFDD